MGAQPRSKLGQAQSSGFPQQVHALSNATSSFSGRCRWAHVQESREGAREYNEKRGYLHEGWRRAEKRLGKGEGIKNKRHLQRTC